jgi:3-hydroxyacyl-CoA dehydrogenase, NAD binding domain
MSRWTSRTFAGPPCPQLYLSACYCLREIFFLQQIEPTLARLHLAETEADAVAGARFVTEAVPEDLEVQRTLFSRLETGQPAVTSGTCAGNPLVQSAASDAGSRGGSQSAYEQRCSRDNASSAPRYRQTSDLFATRVARPFLSTVSRLPSNARWGIWSTKGSQHPRKSTQRFKARSGFVSLLSGPWRFTTSLGSTSSLPPMAMSWARFGAVCRRLPCWKSCVSREAGDQDWTSLLRLPPDRLAARHTRRDSLLLKLGKLLYGVDSADEPE